MAKRKPKNPGTPGTPGTPGAGGGPTGPIKWGNVDLSAIASRLGLPQDADVQAVVGNLSKQNLTPQEIAMFVMDGQKALDWIDAQSSALNNLSPNTAATDVDLDDAEPQTRRMTPEEVEAYFDAAVRGAGSGATRDLELTGGGVRVKGNFRKPPPDGPEEPPAGGKGGKSRRPKNAPPPKPGDPGYFEYQDAQADKKWQERNRNPPIGTGVARWAKRNPEAAAILGLGIGGGIGLAGYGISSLMNSGGEQQQQQGGRFTRPQDQQLLQQDDADLMLPAGAAPMQQPTMQPPSNAGALLMRIRESRNI